MTGLIGGGTVEVWGEGVTTQSHTICTPKTRAVFGFSAITQTPFCWGLASARAGPCH